VQVPDFKGTVLKLDLHLSPTYHIAEPVPHRFWQYSICQDSRIPHVLCQQKPFHPADAYMAMYDKAT
jgi:hypothetical protein